MPVIGVVSLMTRTTHSVSLQSVLFADELELTWKMLSVVGIPFKPLLTTSPSAGFD